MLTHEKPAQKKASPEAVQKKPPEKTTEPKLTGIPESVKIPLENLSGISFDDARVHYNSGKPARLRADAPVIQGKFIGDLSGVLKAIPFEAGLCKNLVTAIEASAVDINVVHTGGVSCYNSDAKMLCFNTTLLTQLKQLYDARTDGTATPAEKKSIVSMTANICHELSHCHDYLSDKVSDTELDSVMNTELRAWHREAISAIETKISLGVADSDSDGLINSWRNVTPAMLDNLNGNLTNEVINRFERYVKRKKPNPQAWLGYQRSGSPRIDYYKGLIDEFKGKVVAKLPPQM